MFDEAKFWGAVRNNLLWLLDRARGLHGLGLLAAQLTDRISVGQHRQSLIFMPMAISFGGPR